MFFNELPNNTSQQLPLIIVGFGFTEAESALFNIIKPIWGALLVLVSAALLYGTDLGVGYTCALSYIPCFVGGIIMVGFAYCAVFSTMADLRRSETAFCALVEQSCACCWHTDLDVQAFVSSRPGLGRNNNNRLHQKTLRYVYLCGGGGCREHGLS